MAIANIRFRLVEGFDVGPKSFPLHTTVSAVKESVLADWPQKGEKAPPQSILELKLILAGRVLDNAMTLHEAKTPAGGELVTMHVVVSAKSRVMSSSSPPAPRQPPSKAKEEVAKEEAPRCTGCVIQ